MWEDKAVGGISEEEDLPEIELTDSEEGNSSSFIPRYQNPAIKITESEATLESEPREAEPVNQELLPMDEELDFDQEINEKALSEEEKDLLNTVEEVSETSSSNEIAGSAGNMGKEETNPRIRSAQDLTSSPGLGGLISPEVNQSREPPMKLSSPPLRQDPSHTLTAAQPQEHIISPEIGIRPKLILKIKAKLGPIRQSLGPSFSPRKWMERPPKQQEYPPILTWILFLLIAIIACLTLCLQSTQIKNNVLMTTLSWKDERVKGLLVINSELEGRLGDLEGGNKPMYATGHKDHSIIIWNSRMEKIETLKGHSHEVSAVIGLETNMLASASFDGTIRLWSLSSFKELGILGEHKRGVLRLAMLKNGSLVTASWDKTVKIWNPYTRELLSVLEGHAGPINSVVEIPEHGLLWTGSRRPENRTFIWDLKTAKSINNFEPHTGSVREILQLPNGNVLTVGMHSKSCMKEWSPQGDLIKMIRGEEEDNINRARLLPDGRVITGSTSGYLKVWDINTGEYLQKIKAFNGNIYGIKVIDQNIILACSDDQTIRKIDLDSGAELHKVQVDSPIHDLEGLKLYRTIF